MTKVSKEEFYKVIYENDLDVCVHVRNNYEYLKSKMVTDFKFRNGELFGTNFHNYDIESDNYGEQEYFLTNKWIKRG
jgi:hypothetical protein